MNNLKEKKMLDDAKRREYLKQQQQLRNMSKPKTNISADAMIENLLSRKEIFQKKAPNSSNVNQSMEIPPSYQLIWEWSRIPGPVEFADTNKISALLMTSRLSTDTLGYIWSLSNQTLAGSLTQSELYITLALVALAQSGYSFRSSSVVNQLGRYPVPILDMSIVTGSPQPVLPSVISSVHPNQEDDDEFDDFKSADLSSLNVDNLKVLEVASTSGATSLIRFDSPKRPLPPALSLLDSPSRSSPTQLSVLDLPLTETSHQPPFDRQTFSVSDKNSPEQQNPPDRPINSISGDISSSPSHVEDLFPKCVVKKANIDLLDWEGPEEYLTCDISNNKVKLSTDSSVDNFTSDVPTTNVQINTISNNFSLDALIDSNISGSVSKISLNPPDPQSDVIEDKTPDNASFKSEDPGEFDNCQATDSIPNLEQMDSSTSGELSLSDFDSKDKSDDSSKFDTIGSNFNTVTNFLDLDDKYSALRGLEPKPNDDFGDFLTAEPVSQQLSTPMFLNQPNIQEQCMDACLKLLNQAICSFETINDEKVLIEVLDDPRCKKYLEELGEVYNVSDRLTKSSDSSKKQELESIWRNLGKLTRQALPQIRPIYDDGKKGVKCGVCLQESSVETQVRYAMNHFHSSCANLYLHCVGGASLPLQPLQ